MRTLLRVALLLVIPAVATIGGLAWWLQGGRYASTENAYVKSDIVKIATEVTGTVKSLHVSDHSAVEAGDVLLQIDSEPFEIALDQAEAELDAARQEVETLRATLQEARSTLAEAESRADYYEQRADRHSRLAKRGVVSTSKLDEIQNDANAAGDRVKMVRRQVDRALAGLGGKPHRPVDLHPLVRAKKAKYDKALLDLKRTKVKAPMGGVAVNVTLQPGEQVQAGTPVFALIADTRPWVEANFKETDLTNVQPGQTATVVLDIYPSVTWEAMVESISPATGAEFAILPPQNASGNWVKVVQRLPVKLCLLRRSGEPQLRAGMTATVWIDTGRQRHLADLIGGAAATAQSAK